MFKCVKDSNVEIVSDTSPLHFENERLVVEAVSPYFQRPRNFQRLRKAFFLLLLSKNL